MSYHHHNNELAGSVSGTGSGSTVWNHRGIGLSNTIHSEVAPCLPLPSLPVFCGSSESELRLFNEPGRNNSWLLNRPEIISHAARIADLLRETDVSYLNLREDPVEVSYAYAEPFDLHDEVLRFNPEAFDVSAPGPIEEQISVGTEPEKKPEPSVPITSHGQRDYIASNNHQFSRVPANDISTPPSRKTRAKRKVTDEVSTSVEPDPSELQDAAIKSFCELVENFCCKAEIEGDERDESEWLSLPLSDLRILVNEVMSIRAKKHLHLIPVDILVRLLRVMDHQIHRAEGLSVNDCDHSDSDMISSIFCGLESIHAALAVMAHNEMPKQIYKEEIIERVLEFTKHQMMDVMCACDPAYRALHRPVDNGGFEVEEDEENGAERSSATKRRRTVKTVKVKKSSVNKVSSYVNTILQKMCTILGLLKDLLLIEKLSDSCILQLIKTSFTTFLVDNIQLLQLKAISLLSAIFYFYTQHRTYVIDELLQILCKLPFSKRSLRAYHLPDEEQRQIQMITALLIQLVHCSTNLPEVLRQASAINPMLEVSVEANYPIKCLEAVNEACCLFWTRVLERFSNKSQEANELKVIMENLVTDLLTTLNLPEYPGAAPILQVLCILLLQNAGPKCKDIAVRTMAIEILGTIGARLKRDAACCSKDKFWILQLLDNQDGSDLNYSKDECSICYGGGVDSLCFVCQGCQRIFHADCMGVREDEVPNRGWYCQICLSRKQLLLLQSYSKSQCKEKDKKGNNTESSFSIREVEIVQQLLLNNLQDSNSADDVHIFIRWFYLCLWYKDDPKSQKKLMYYLARLNSKAIVRDSSIVSSFLTRDSIKKVALALAQKNSFSRGFDKILHTLLASLRENSSALRAKALRAVSIIIEADPEVLCDPRVQLVVEGRFCDSSIQAREAALELVGRHIASHPGVGLKYFDKVAERVKDTGVSVRKRAIKIIRDMCTSNENFSELTRACIEIISRVGDEESSIQDLVCKTLFEFWFEEPSGSQIQYFGDGSSVPVELVKKTEQIVEMMKQMPNHQHLVTVIKRNLALDFFPQSTKAVGINPLLLQSVRTRCELMCKCLLERILQVEEMSNQEVEMRALPYVLVLQSFCSVDPTLCAPASDPSQFVVTLQPYLKSQSDNRVVARLLESIIYVIDSVLPLLRKLPQSVVEELEQDLKHMIVRHSFLNVVHACIKCVCALSKVGGKGATVVEHLILFFFKLLDAQAADAKQHVGRSLFCLGTLIRYGDSLLTHSSDRRIDIVRSIDVFKKYLHMDDFVLKVRSLQALGYLLIARPEFMLEKDIGKILEVTLSSGSDDRIKMQALQNIYEYLLDAESQMGRDKVSKDSNNETHYSVEGGQAVPVAAGAGDTNICGGITQLYWDHILGRCLDFNEKIRQTALKIVEVVLRQGLVHPITCVPCLIALETDPLEANSKLAHHLLLNMNEKYPSFFESRLGDGLQMSFMFLQCLSTSSEHVNAKTQSNMKGKSDALSLTQTRLGVSRIYKLIRGNRVSRNKFMSSIIRKFDTPIWNTSVVPFLMYCTEVLALLPFTSPDEPLYLVYAINRVIQVRAGVLEAKLKALTVHFSQRVASHQNGRNRDESTAHYFRNEMSSTDGTFQHEQASHNYMLSMDLNGTMKPEQDGQFVSDQGDRHSATSGDSSCISKDDEQMIQGDCLSAIALQLLLKLKRHLKIMYSLNDSRCQAFSPTEQLKSGDALSRQNIPFNIGEARMNSPSTYQELVEVYQEFKNALREDTVDYSTYTANIKRKRPTPRKPRKLGNMPAGGDDDDEYDDEDYSGGRRLSNSVRRSVNTRSRVRF